MNEFSIEILSLPGKEELQDFASDESPKESFKEFLLQEFDSEVSLKIGDRDLLSGYPEAYIIPVHAFLREFSHSLDTLAREGKVSIPIYLQQYEISKGDPAHKLECEIRGEELFITFVWGGEGDPPSAVAGAEEIPVDLGSFREKVCMTIDDYQRKTAMLLANSPGWTPEEISRLFLDFGN